MSKFVTIAVDAETGKCICECGSTMEEDVLRQNFVCPKCNSLIPSSDVENLVGSRKRKR